MLFRYISALSLVGIIFMGSLFLSQSVFAETLVESVAETRLMMAMHVAQAELQKRVPAPWQVISIPGGPFKAANFFMVFIDSFLVQDAQGKPDKEGSSRRVVFAVPAKNTQTGEISTMVIGGFIANPQSVPGPYKNFGHAAIQRVHTQKGDNSEAGTGEDSWEVRDNNAGIIELRIQYQRGLPFRAKSEQKIYSAADPSFYRTYRIESATDMIKSVPVGLDRVQNYHFRATMPELSNLFKGTEQLVGIATFPLFVRQVFLP